VLDANVNGRETVQPCWRLVQCVNDNWSTTASGLLPERPAPSRSSAVIGTFMAVDSVGARYWSSGDSIHAIWRS
jgi:hypothetical protein